jgi:hypothetical protein
MWPEVVEGSQKTTATMMATTATINIFTGGGARMTGRIVVLRVSPVAEYAAPSLSRIWMMATTMGTDAVAR